MDLNVAKGITLFVLFLIPVVLGSLTLYLFTRYRPILFDSSQGLSFLSYLKCFSGGFFLGTSFMVVLSQGLERFEEYRNLVHLPYTFPFFEIGIGAGFFLVALVEKLIYLTFTLRRKQDGEETDQKPKTGIFQMTPRSSSSTFQDLYDDDVYEIPDDTLEILAENRETKQKHQAHMYEEDPIESSKTTSRRIQHGDDDGKAPSSGAKNRSDEGSGGKSLLQESVSDAGVSTLRIGMLVLALSFHTVFDGLAVGLQTKTAEVFSLLLAIAFHKAVTSVVLGIELATVFTIQNPSRPFLALLLFSLASPLGVAIGIGVTSGPVHQSAKLLTGAVLQAVATGVFLYVTCFEILERDMASKKDQGAVPRVLTAVLGFGMIAVMETAAKG